MTPVQIFFIVVALVTLSSAVMVVSARRMMHAALWLILTLLGVAVLFALLEASFFAVVQVVIYIGGIAILIIFAIMMTRHANEDTTPGVNRYWWIAAPVAIFMFTGLLIGLYGWSGFQTEWHPLPAGGGDVAGLGKVLVDAQGYLIPFEIASVLLLAALVGAIYLVSDRKSGRR